MIAWLVQNAVVVFPLAAVIAVVCRLLRPAPAVCHALWLLVLLKLVMPPLPVWRSAWLDEWFVAHSAAATQPSSNDIAPVPQPTIRAQPRSGITARVTEVLVVEPQTALRENSRVAEPNEAAVTRKQTSNGKPEVVGNAGEPLAVSAATWQVAVGAILSLWALGAVVVVLSHVRRALRLRRALKQSCPPAPSFSCELAVHCRSLRVPLPNARLCTGLPCPMVVALPRATLLWPAGLEDRLDEPGRRAVLIHELAHLKRRDHRTAWLEVAVACLWWWHPIVWWARRELRQYAELACDAWVVAHLPKERTRYAKALVDVCEFISLAKPAAAPAVGMARGNRRSFERRLHMILRQRIAARMPLVGYMSVVVAALLVLPGFSTGQDDPDRSNPQRIPGEREPVPAPEVPTKDESTVVAPVAGEKREPVETYLKSAPGQDNPVLGKYRDGRYGYFERVDGNTAKSNQSKMAKVQSLLRVSYDMPLDKAEVLARFLKENVKGEIEARTDQKGLIVTAEVGIQRTVAGIVALMTGEPVTLDLGGGSPAGYATVQVPVYRDGSNPNAGLTTYYAPATVAQPGEPGVYPPPPAAKRELRTRTVIEIDPTTGKQIPRTVLEERVFGDQPAENRDPSLPRLHTPQPTKESTESPKEPPASARDSSSVFQFSVGVAR